MPRIEFGLPSLGHTMEGAVILRWSKRAGEDVAQGETLVEVETDKVEVEIDSPVSGRVVELLVSEGESCPVGTVIAVFDTDP